MQSCPNTRLGVYTYTELRFVQRSLKRKVKLDVMWSDDLTWKNPGGIGPPGMPSPGGMFPRTGLGAAAALCRRKTEKKLI